MKPDPDFLRISYLLLINQEFHLTEFYVQDLYCGVLLDYSDGDFVCYVKMVSESLCC